MTAAALTWVLVGLGIVGTTVWGNIEFRRRPDREHSGHGVRQDMSAFSPTINEVDTRHHGGIYNVNGTDIDLQVSDRRPRKIFTSTILLRNRAT